MRSNEPVRPRVLIVEDEMVVATDLQETLVELGYEVLRIANTGQGAIRVSEEEAPDVVLMDIRLRGKIDGIAAANEITRRWRIPVVFVTGSASDELLARAKATGAYGYLIKPFRSQELDATVSVAIHQSRLSRALFSEHEWLHTMLDSLSGSVIATDLEGHIRYMNPSAEQLTGWMHQDAHGKPFREVFTATTLSGDPVDELPLERALSGKRAHSKEQLLLKRKDGRVVPVEGTASPIAERGRTTGAISICVDISDRLRRERDAEAERDRLEEQVHLAEETLGQTRSELRALSGQLITAQEEERRRVAREIHDDFCQTAAVLEIDAVRAISALHNNAVEAEQILRIMKTRIAEMGTRLTSISHQLHPSVIEDLGFVSALRSLVEDLKQSGAQIRLRAPEWVDVELNVATALYRVAQEALRNALKHAPGAPVRVLVTLADHHVHLKIDDSGPGFQIAQARSAGGLGLLSMQERVRLVGGSFQLKTQPGHGTVVAVRVPIRVAAKDAV